MHQQFRRQKGQIGALEQQGSDVDQAAERNRSSVEARPWRVAYTVSECA
jgi:hypothetical protein